MEHDGNEDLIVGEYILAIAGYAMIRHCLTTPSEARPRVEEMRRVLAGTDTFPYSLVIPLREHDVEDGYTSWAPRYDGPNPAIELEEPIVHPMLEAAAPGVALDAACGTGRHAAKLVELGHRVIGVDTTRDPRRTGVSRPTAYVAEPRRFGCSQASIRRPGRSPEIDGRSRAAGRSPIGGL